MNTSKLPNAHLAKAEERKLRDYLLNLGHRQGGPKAKFFLGRGFSESDWEGFADALCYHAKNNPVILTKTTLFGVNYSLDCHLPTPDNSKPCIRTVWEIRTEDERPRLITAHPLG